MKVRTLTAAALAATLAAGCTDGPEDLPLTGRPEEGGVQQADNAAAYARAHRLGCTVAANLSVTCPKLWLLKGTTYFPSVDGMWKPRKPKLLTDQSTLRQNLVEDFHRELADPANSRHSEHTLNLGRYVVENLEAEDAMARAGCETMEDACANAVKAALGWRGLQSPGTAGAEAYWVDKAERIEVLRERQQ